MFRSLPIRFLGDAFNQVWVWVLPRGQVEDGYAALWRKRSEDICFCGLFIFASGLGQTFLISLFQPYWRAALDLSAGALGALYGIATLISGLLMPWTGRWLDGVSSGQAAGLTLAGLTVACIMAAGATSSLTLGLAMFLLRFFGQGLSVNLGLTYTARWFDHNRGKAISLVGLGFPLGEAVLPFLGTFLILTIGWRGAWLALASLCVLVLAPVAYSLIARRSDSRGNVLAAPESLPAAKDSGGLFRDWRFYVMLLNSTPLPFVATGVIFFQATIAEKLGWSATAFPLGLLCSALIRVGVSLSAGAWVDRIGSVRWLALPAIFFALGVTLLTRTASPMAYAFFVFVGFSFGVSSSLGTVAWAELFGTGRLGSLKGWSSGTSICSAMLAPIVFGWAFDAGIALNAVLFTCALGLVGVSTPLSCLLARHQRIKAGQV
jgi:MFS family permease